MKTKHILLTALLLSISLAQPALNAVENGKKKIVFVAGTPSHGYGSHEHKAGSILLADILNDKLGDKIKAEVVSGGWPKDSKAAFKNADALVFFCTGGGRHFVLKHLDETKALMDKGVGLGCIHYGVEVPKGDGGNALRDWIGGYFEPFWSVNPHWTAEFKEFPKHPAANGIKPFSINDEWYFHMRFQKDMKGVTPILSAVAPESTMKRGDGPHSGNPHVRASVKRGDKQHVGWVYERPNGGRGFGFTGAHVHSNWANDNFRKAALNALCWIAKVEVPEGGVPSKTPTREELEANQDYPKPGGAKPRKKSSSVTPGKASKNKAKFASKVIDKNTKGRSVEISADIKGAKELYLVVTDGLNGFAHDWANWVSPRLIDGNGKETPITSMKWSTAQTGWGNIQIGKNAGGQAMKVEGKAVTGIGTHAISMISYKLPANHKFATFKAIGALDDGGINQNGSQSSVEFLVFTEKPAATIAVAVSGPAGGAGRVGEQGDPKHAIENLNIHEDVKATLFASEPMMLSPSSIDIDHKGRVWVCEVVNYRRHKNKRAEGDRILILEDTDGDNKADKVKTFYQGRDIDSAHGVSVFGDKIVVSCGDKIIVFTDKDGDDKPDSKENLFTGISGTQHDHGIHAVHFGPDGKYYFNFGNSGHQIKDKDGKPIIDKAGNEVNDKRKPYQQGMVFRCNPDGSDFETLGWNFRNNWEVCVDSFGTIWQSDNDDDGNRGVRINYVMEFGNYGYRGEMTGRGWRDKRSNIEKEVPLRHWHLNDPGVVPNLLQTGAGSPTGIISYEGNLLPSIFRGQVIHCDAGPSIVRAYPVQNAGAGYSAEIVNLLDGSKRDKWFRPSDVTVAPDGSLIVADWYDPGVGGHNMRDLDRGRLFLVAPEGHKYKTKGIDLSSLEGAAEALKSPNMATRYLAWNKLHDAGKKAESALKKLWDGNNAIHRARAIWLLGKIEGKGQQYVDIAIGDKDPNIRIAGLRLARQNGADVIGTCEKLAKDKSAQVRREVAIAIRDSKSPKAAGIWAELAAQHDGVDRWYLEALGISANGQWDAFFSAWLKKVDNKWNTPAGRDIIWRSRASDSPGYIVKILKDKSTPAEAHPRYMRALDFHSGPAREKALEALLDI
jgi:putative membrane-bound dehydrogenase-like protein